MCLGSGVDVLIVDDVGEFLECGLGVLFESRFCW